MAQNHRNVLPHSSGGQKSKIKVLARLGPSEAVRENLFQFLVPLLQFLVVCWQFLGVPWLAAATLQSLLLLSHGSLPSCVCVSSPLLEEKKSFWIKGPPYSTKTILTDYIGNGPVSKEGHSLRYWGLGLQRIFREGHNSTHNAFLQSVLHGAARANFKKYKLVHSPSSPSHQDLN